jgi:ferredoxin-NADP reductase
MIQLQLTRIADESPIVRTFHFQPERPLDYQPGQFIELYLPHQNVDNRGIYRQFTLSSSPSETEIAITAKRPPDGFLTSTYKQTLWKLQPGDTAQTSDPLGDFVLPFDNTIPLVWVAGGMGIAPFRSQAIWLAHSGEERTIQLIHSIHGSDEQIFGPTFHHPPITLRYLDSSLGQRLTTQAVLKKLNYSPESDEALFYISGPEPMVESLARGLQASGIARGRIVSDAFLGYGS